MGLSETFVKDHPAFEELPSHLRYELLRRERLVNSWCEGMLNPPKLTELEEAWLLKVRAIITQAEADYWEVDIEDL